MKKGLVFLLILSLYTAAGFCGGQEEVISEEASVLSGSVMVYTSMSRSVIEVVKAGFEADNPMGCPRRSGSHSRCAIWREWSSSSWRMQWACRSPHASGACVRPSGVSWRGRAATRS